MRKPLVTVFCITYNHKRFIRPCLESLVNQKCEFPYEIIIYDDASTDGTREIIMEFQERYPDLIRPVLREENHWLKNPVLIVILYTIHRLKANISPFVKEMTFGLGKISFKSKSPS